MSSFNNSSRRDDVSLKLRSQNMRHTRDQTKKLEEESRKMEDRLKELKTAMSREKEERERQGGGFWGRGQTNTGSLTSYASEVLQSKVEKPVKEGKKKKIKILQDEPIEVPKRSSQPGTFKHISQRKLPTGSTPRDKQKGPKCGQCEDRSATLSCVQCSEIYCAGCFAAFHLRGALKQHRSCPISATGGRVCMSPRPSVDAASPRGSQASGSVVSYPKPTYPVDGSEASGPRSAHTTPRQGDAASLLQGDYDESQSAASFQQALMAWRQGDETESPQQSARRTSKPIASPVRDPVVSMDSSTGTTEETKVPDIKFKGSLSYVEKLMLKKHRRTELSECGTPRLTDQSSSSSRLSDHSDSSSNSRFVHQREKNVSRRDDGVASPLSRKGYRGRDEYGAREQSFIDDGERVNFQSLYEAVVSTEGSCVNTPRSEFSIMEVTDSTVHGFSPTTKPSASLSSYTTDEATPYDSWMIEDRRQRESSAKSGAQKSGREYAALNSQEVLPDKFTSAKPNSKYSIEDMFPNQSPPTPQQNFYNDENSWDEFGTTPRPTSVIDGDEGETKFNRSSKMKKNLQHQQEGSTFSDETTGMFSLSSTNEVPQQVEMPRPKSSKSKSRPGSARAKTASKSRPVSRAQSRAASRMMMADGLLTKTPSKALSEIANLATNDDVTTSMTLTYQSPLEGFFLAGVDLAGIAQQSEKSNEEKTITPSKYSSSTSLASSQQRPKSRSGQAALKSARGEREAIKVSNRLYQMAPRSWRPDSSLGETIPLDDVHVDQGIGGDQGQDEEEMVLSYRYSGQMGGQATEWRPSSSQSSIAADNQFEDELNLIQQSSSHHPHNTSNPLTSGFGTGSDSSRRSTTPHSTSRINASATPDLSGYGDSSNRRSHHHLQQSISSPQPPSLPPSNDVTSSSISRRKSANRRSLGASSSSLSNTTTPTPNTPTPMTPEIPSTPKTPTNRNPGLLSSRSSTSASLRRSRILDAENENSTNNVDSRKQELSSHDISPSGISKSSATKKSQLMGNLLPSKSEIPFTTRSKSKITAGNDPNLDSISRSNTQTSGIVRSGSNMSRGPSRPSSKFSISGEGALSRRHSNADQTQHQQQKQNQRPSSSTVSASGAMKGQRSLLSATKGRPVSSTVSKGKSGHNSIMASQSMDMDERQDSIIADVMSTRVHADGWMMGDDDSHDDNGYYDDSSDYYADEKGQSHGSHRDTSKMTSKKISDSSHWETEVRPFTRESLDSAKVRRSGQGQGDERGMSTRPSSTMSGRESRAIVMDGEDLSTYDAMLDPEERNEEDQHALEQLEWELASDTGRLTADGQISRLGAFDQDDYSGSHSSSRSSSSRSIRFCADKEYDLTSKLLEDERIAEQDSLNIDLERNVTLDEDEVKALR